MVEFNIIETVGATAVDLAPYPNGSAVVPDGSIRKIYLIILSDTSGSANTLTLTIYKGTSSEKSITFNIGGSLTTSFSSDKNNPILIVPSGRKITAVAGAQSVNILLTGVEE